LLSAVFVGGLPLLASLDVDTQVVAVVSGEEQVAAKSPLDRLLVVRSGMSLFFENWLSSSATNDGVEKITAYMDQEFERLSQEMAEDAGLVLDIGHVAKKYVPLLFKYSSLIEFSGIKDRFVMGNQKLMDLMKNQSEFSEINTDLVELSAQIKQISSDIVSLIKKHKADYDTANLEGVLDILLNNVLANFSGAQNADLTDENRMQIMQVLMDVKQEVFSSFSDEDLMGIMNVVQEVGAVIDPSLIARIDRESTSSTSFFVTSNSQYDFASNTLVTALPIVRDDSLVIDGGFKVLVSKNAEGSVLLHVPSSVLVEEKEVSREVWGRPQDPSMVLVYNSFSVEDFSEKEEILDDSCGAECVEEDCIECVE